MQDEDSIEVVKQAWNSNGSERILSLNNTIEAIHD